MTYTGEELDLVLFKAHPGAAPITEAAAGELARDLLFGDSQSSGDPLEHHDERSAVRLSGGEITEHGWII
jgi:hypothetical protein